MIQRLKCRLGLHRYNKWLSGFVHGRRIEARSCIHCGKIDARFPAQQEANQ